MCFMSSNNLAVNPWKRKQKQTPCGINFLYLWKDTFTGKSKIKPECHFKNRKLRKCHGDEFRKIQTVGNTNGGGGTVSSTTEVQEEKMTMG